MFSTVLIIDKRPELSIKYKKSLTSSEINTIVANTLKDALIEIQKIEPDMIIISDSIEEELASFCERVRALTYTTRPIIIALSKSAETDDKIKVLESGADDFLSEPVSIEEFKTRIKAHLRRDIESNLDNKTLLPNEKFVKKTLKRILNTENQAVLLASIENLENYKTVYTELASDKILQTFIAIVKSTLNESDFIGQINETNFIITTNKYNAEKLAEFITFAFDTVAPKFYSDADIKRGYSLLKGEKYAGMRVNFVSVLIGGIIEDLNKNTTVESLINKLQCIKQIAKIPEGSNYAIERPQISGKDSVIIQTYNRSIFIKENDSSLKLLLQTTLELQGYDVDDEINHDSAIQPKIMILDSGNNLEELDFIKNLRKDKKFVNTKFIVTSNIHDKSTILSSGADLYLPKPYEISDLIKWVEYFFK